MDKPSMKNFVTGVRMTSNFKMLLERVSEGLPLQIPEEEKDRIAEMMTKGYDSLLEGMLVEMFMKDEKLAMEIGDRLAEKGRSPMKLLYEAATEQVAFIIVYQALLFYALGGFKNEDE